MRNTVIFATMMLATPGLALAQADRPKGAAKAPASTAGRAAPAAKSGKLPLTPQAEAICAKRNRAGTDARARQLNQLCGAAGR